MFADHTSTPLRSSLKLASGLLRLASVAVLVLLLSIVMTSAPVAQTFSSTTTLQNVTVTASTGEKPQSKVWTHDGYWFSVLSTSSGTYLYRLDGTAWTSLLQVSAAANIHADVKPVGAVSHILLYAGTSSQLVSVEYVPASHTYQMWSVRPSAVNITLDTGVETATIDIDSQGRMWLASDASTDINIRWSDSPYSTWSSPITLASGVSSDDIGLVTTLNNGSIGVLWSNQNTQRFGFRVHTDGADPSTWSADEVPASQSALNVGLGMADDHMNVAVASNGTLYAAVKTSYDVAGYTKIALLVRRPAGTWDNLYEVSQSGTRAIVVLNEVLGKITVVYTSTEGQGDILYRQSNLSPIAFGSAQTLISGSYNEATSTRQNYSGNIVLMATNVPGSYVTGVLASHATPLQDSLVAHWAMDENSGSTLVDSSTYANTAYLRNSPVWTTGVKNYALSVNGTSQYAAAANSASLNPTNTITLAAWISPTKAAAATQRVITKAVMGTTNGYELSLATTGKVFVRFNQVTQGDVLRVNSLTSYPLNGSAWMHCAATYDGTTIRLYINGVEEATLTPTPFTIAANTDSVFIGRQNGGTAYYYQGSLDDARIYNRALTAAEILQLAAVTTHTITASAGANGSISPSGSVSVNHAANQTFTITPNPGYHTDSVIVDGAKVDSTTSFTFYNVTADHTIRAVFAANVSTAAALQFNGSSQYVTFGRSPGLDSLGARTFTLECWLKMTGAGATASTGTGGLSAAVPVVTKGRGEGESPANLNMNYFFGISGNKLAADFEDTVNGGNHPISGVTTLSTGTWYHAAVTYDGTTWKLYLNGQLDSSKAVNFIPEYRSIQHAGLATAMTSTGATSGFFQGILDEVRIWNYARTQTEIQQTINAELSSPQTGLIARWGLNDGTGLTATNSIAGRPNGTLTPAVTPPTWVTPGAPFNLVITPPAAPSGLTAAALNYYKISLGWADNSSDESAFQIWRSADGISFSQLASVPAGTVSYIDSAVNSGSTYYYRVRATNTAGSSAFSNDANATTPTEGGNALKFGASGAYVTFGPAPSLNTTVFTIETWFRRDGVGIPVTTGTGGIAKAIPLVTKGTSETEDTLKDINYFLGIDSVSGVLIADFERSPGSQNYPISGVTPITTGVWYHAAATYDGTMWKLYLNGIEDASLTIGPGIYPTANTVSPVALGTSIRSNGTTTQGFFDGTLDETRIWSYPRTQLDIVSSANLELTAPQTGLIARWGLNEGTGAVVHGNAGTYVNGSVAGSGYSWVPGAPFNLTFNMPPAQPMLIAPADDATGIATSPELLASVSDPDGDDLTVNFYGRAFGTGPDFTVVLLPDAQYYTGALNGGSNAILKAQTQWITNNRASKNIVFVSQLGDCTEHGDNSGNPVEWQRADTSFKIIEDAFTTGLPYGIPYGISVGNHDQSPIGTPDGGTTVFYNQYFGESRFTGRSYYGGHYGSNNDNHFQLFSASGMDFIAISFEYDTSPDGAILHWADSLLKAYPTRRAIVSSHWIINTGIPGSFSTQGQAIYDSLKDNSNLFLLACGHVPGEGRRQDVFNGDTVYSILSDYQSRTNGGNGWLKTLEFSPANNVIRVKTYSPTLDQYETDSDSQYDLPYNMNGTGFQLIGTQAGVLSGSTTSITWPALGENTQYEWYATANDGQYTSTSSTWSFTTGYDPRTITASAGANGSISPSGLVPVSYGGNQVFTITANPGYHLTSLTVDGIPVDTASSYTFMNVVANHSVHAEFAINQYTITATAGANGSISPSGPVLVNHGDSATFTLAPNTGYQIAEVVVDGVSQGVVPSYTFHNVTTNHTIDVAFAVLSYTINASSGPGGTIDPAGDINVVYGANQSFTITPDSGYHILDVLVDGSSAGPVGSYDFTNVMASHSIEASFAINTYTITSVAGPGGTIDPSGDVLVTHGSNQNFTITPNPGYHVYDVLVDSVSVGADLNYQFNEVTKAHSIEVSFAIDQFTIAASSVGGGSISPSGEIVVNYGSDQTFTLTANEGYEIADLVVDGIPLGVLEAYTFAGVAANHTIQAFFTIKSYTIVATAGPGGSIDPSGFITATWGSNHTFTITPNLGYHILDVVVDGESIGPMPSYEFQNVIASHSIEATFAIDQFTIEASAGPGGNVDPMGAITVEYGFDATFTITPDPGYYIVDVTVDGSSVGPVGTYTFDDVAAGHTIHAMFAIYTYTITATVYGNGTIDPSGVVVVNFGGSTTFTFSPAIGHQIADVVVDGISYGVLPDYTFSNVTANHSIDVYFAIQAFTIVATAGPGGTIDPSGFVQVNYGSNQGFTIIPAPGFHILDVVVNEASIGPVAFYEFPNVTASHSIHATFEINTYTIMASAGPNGSISPSGAVSVIHGNDQAFTITPDPGYGILDVLVDGNSVGPVPAYMFPGVSAQHSIQATFVQTAVAPAFTSTPVITGRISELYTYDCNATGLPDPTFSLVTSPVGMTINSVTGLVEWTPASAGTFNVSIQASNIAGNTLQGFVIAVSCCVGTTGNVNTTGIVDLSDLSHLICYLTQSGICPLPCPAEANVNGMGIIDLGDLSLLIAYLITSPRPVLPTCP